MNHRHPPSSHPSPADPVFRVFTAVSAAIVMLWVALMVGCGNSGATTTSRNGTGKPSIVTTTGMVRDLVLALVGSDAKVTAIMGPGVDPHLYQPTRGDAVKLLDADIVVYNGLHLEGRLGEVLEKRSQANRTTIGVGETLSPDRLLDADAGVHDPHIWMDVSLWSEAATLVAQQLAAAMPEHADAIGGRARAYQEQLAVLDRWGADTIATIPDSKRVLVTAHDAFQYFGRRYGIEVHGVQGVSTVSDAAISDVNRLVELIVSRKVPAVFFETSVSPRQVKAIVEGARQRGLEVSSDSTLLSDSMGADGTPQGTYIGMMRHNIRTIAEALGGKAADSQVAGQDSNAWTREASAGDRLPASARGEDI